MDALEEIVEGEPTIHGNHDLRIENEGARPHGTNGLHHFGEIARERLPRFRLKLDRPALPEKRAHALSA